MICSCLLWHILILGFRVPGVVPELEVLSSQIQVSGSMVLWGGQEKFTELT